MTYTLGVLLSLLLGWPSATMATADTRAVEVPSREEVETTLSTGEALSGRELYDRLLKNKKRLRTTFQRGRILSTHPGGSPQVTRFWSYWQDHRDVNDEAVDGIYSTSLVKLSGPYEVRHTGYLYVHRSDRSDDQYMYTPNRRRTLRVHIKGQNVQGTDFSIDDFQVSLDDLEDATYRRLPDETVQGVPCYVVEAVAKPTSSSTYTRSIVSLEQEHYVPLRTRYWDEAGVESRLLTSPHASIEEFDGSWVPTESTIVDLLEDTSSTMHIDRLVPNPPLDPQTFSLTRLEASPEAGEPENAGSGATESRVGG